MDTLIPFVGAVLLLGAATIGGVFFAFSSFVMKALSQMPAAEGIASMQSINRVVINRSFLAAFLGTALLSLVVVVMAAVDKTNSTMVLFFAGATFYLAGTFLVTIFGNVPLNDRLATVSATDPETVELWSQYLIQWTRWNHVRTVAAMVSALLCAAGLLNLAIA